MFRQVERKRINLFILVIATQFLDLLWGLFTLLGIEGGISGGQVSDNQFDIPWSHSLLMAGIWSLLFAVLINVLLQNNGESIRQLSLWSGIAVFSHWILDIIVHSNDMLFTPWGGNIPTLNLWSIPLLAFTAEFLIILGSGYWFVTNEEATSELSQRVLIIAGLYAGIHIIFSVLTFFGEAAEVPNSYGIITILSIVVIAGIPYFLYRSKS